MEEESPLLVGRKHLKPEHLDEMHFHFHWILSGQFHLGFHKFFDATLIGCGFLC